MFERVIPNQPKKLPEEVIEALALIDYNKIILMKNNTTGIVIFDNSDQLFRVHWTDGSRSSSDKGWRDLIEYLMDLKLVTVYSWQ